MPNPIDNEDLYISIVLGGVPSPGQVTLSAHDREYGWDVKSGTAQSGATITRKSDDPIAFTCNFYLVKDEADGIDDFALWPDFLALIKSTVAGKEPKALDIYHPDLSEVGIKSVVLKKQLGTIHDGKGGQTKGILFLEYIPPKKTGGTPSGSKTSAKNDPNQKALDELDALTKQYEKTPWG